MGKRGPAPKPTALKKLQGNMGRRPLNENEPALDTTMPACPRWLTAEARAEWRRVATKLHKAGILTNVDRAVLAAYCQAWSDWVSTSKQLEQEPTVIVPDDDTGKRRYLNPTTTAANSARDAMIKYARELGMTPSARTGIKIEQVKRAENIADFLFSTIDD
jgi:P27 family predicted phage terminase small subunit